MLKEGEKFGKLTVIKFSHKVLQNKRYRYFYLCKCSCDGKEIIVREDGLTSGHTKSCGCIHREKASETFTTHGLCKSRFYTSWGNMLGRCKGRGYWGYINYKSRGISVCDRWLDFENFKEDMYESYQKHVEKYGEKNTTLDRIDVNGGYEPSNCRWATIIEQANNKRDNHLITYKGETHSIADWSRKLNINYSALVTRIKRGWSIERAFTEKIHIKGG